MGLSVSTATARGQPAAVEAALAVGATAAPAARTCAGGGRTRTTKGTAGRASSSSPPGPGTSATCSGGRRRSPTRRWTVSRSVPPTRRAPHVTCYHHRREKVRRHYCTALHFSAPLRDAFPFHIGPDRNTDKRHRGQVTTYNTGQRNATTEMPET